MSLTALRCRREGFLRDGEEGAATAAHRLTAAAAATAMLDHTHTLSLSLSLKHTHTRIHTREHTRKKKMELEQEHFSLACTLKNEGFRVTMAYIGYKCFHIWASILGRPSQTLTLNIVKVLENKWCASHRRSHKYQYVHMRPTSPAMTQNNARI